MKKPDIIGKTLAEVADILDISVSFRVSSHDGVPMVVTRDHRPDRLNLRLVDGKVVDFNYG